MLYQRVLFPIVLFAASASTAFGGIMLVNDPGSPTGGLEHNVVRDTDTGLDWPVWTASTSIRYGEMLLQLEPGGLYHGWTHADIGQVKTLFDNITGSLLFTANWPDPTVVNDNGSGASILLSTLGTTNNVTAFHSTMALTATPILGQGQIVAIAQRRPTETRASAEFPSSQITNDALVGNALFRESQSVPEPSSIVLMGLGAIGFGIVRLRRKRKLRVA